MPTLRLSRGSVEYQIVRTRRRTVGVVVREDGAVVVRAPLRASARTIVAAVEELRPWIERKHFAALARLRRRPSRRFDPGDRVPYLGTELTLEIVETGVPGVDPVVRRGAVLQVRVPAGLTTASRRAVTKHAVRRWLLGEAREVFHRRHVRAAKAVGRSAVRVVIKDMKTRWGSCGPNRRMSLNWRLILAPLHVVDYVLIHELVHITVPDHSPRFWSAVEQACSHWDVSRRWLRDHGDDLVL